MRESFFGRLRSHFKTKADGRYLGTILAEVGRKHPAALCRVLERSCKLGRRLRDAQFVPEYYFDGGRRRADLAVVEGDPLTNAPTLLVEIKYYDKPGDGQLEAYRQWASQDDRRRALLLTRENWRADGLYSLRWTEAAALLRSDARESDIVDALVKHLEEEGLVVQKINKTSLLQFFGRLFFSNMQAARNIDGPAEFAKLLSNMKQLAGLFDRDFKDARKAAAVRWGKEDARSQAGTVDFDLMNYVRGGADCAGGLLARDKRDGGYVEVFVRYIFGYGDDRLVMRFGYCFDFKMKKQDPSGDLFVWIWAKALGGDQGVIYLTRPLGSFNNITVKAEESAGKIEAHVRGLVMQGLDACLEQSRLLGARQRTALRGLRKSLNARIGPVLA